MTSSGVRARRCRAAALLSALVAITTAAPAAAATPATVAAPPSTADGGAAGAEAELAAKYQPFIAIREHLEMCGPGEAFLPSDALAIIEQPEVVLRDGKGNEITTAPTAADLAAAPDDGSIDFPGSALELGCGVERWFRGTGPPRNVVYGRVTTEPERPGFLVLQYWYYFVYNDWNNRHEGDWEMMQLIFEADSAEAALALDPSTVVVAQHDGAQRSSWHDVERRDGRPVVYVARGSHATFFRAQRWIGKGAETGFGCDDTRAPNTVLDTDLEVVPSTIERSGEFGWLLWEGRWGERGSAFNDGSEGPVATPMWATPVSWADELAREDSLPAPDFGPATDFFCTASAGGSVLLIKLFDKPALVGGLLAAVIVVLIAIGRRTRWARVTRPLATKRRSGQVLTSAAALLLAERRRFIAISLLLLAAGVLASLWRALLMRIPAVSDAQLLLAGDGTSGALFALLQGAVVTVPVSIIAFSLAVLVADDLDTAAAGARTRIAALARRPGFRSVLALVVLGVVLLGPISFVVGAYFVTRWSAAPILAVHGEAVGASLRASSRLTDGHRWKTGIVLLLALLLAALAGPLAGTLTMLVTGLSLTFVNVIAGLVSAVLVPWLAVVLVMLHRNVADNLHA